MKIGDLLKHILVINLDKDKERLENVKSSIEKDYPCSKLWRVNAIYGKDLENINEYRFKMKCLTNTDSTIGCGLSHIKAWKMIIENNLDFAVIVEDDVTFSTYLKNSLDVDLPEKWDIIYLGHAGAKWPRNACSSIPSPDYSSNTKISDRWYKFTNSNEAPMGAWAYVVTNNAAKYLIRNYKLNIPVDNFLSDSKTLNDLNIYGSYPSLILHCYQFGSHTDSNNTVLSQEKSNNNEESGSIRKRILFWIEMIFIFVCLVLSFSIFYKYYILLKIGIFIIIMLSIFYIYFKRQQDFSERYVRESKRYINLPGIYGEHYFDPFGNVWIQEDKDKLIYLIKKISDICSSNNIPFSPCAGTLIGWARHDKKVIPWDDDADFMIPVESRKLFESLVYGHEEFIISPLCVPYDLKISLKNGKDIHNRKYTFPFIDIYYYTTHDDKKLLLINGVEVPFSNSYTTFKDVFEGVSLDIPSNYEKILDIEFPGWKTRCISSDYNHRLERAIDKRYIEDTKCSYVI